MIRLALLLIGGNSFRRRWWAPAVVGILLIILSFVVAADVFTGLAFGITLVIGVFLIVHGLFALWHVSWHDEPGPMLARCARPVLFTIIGCLIVWSSSEQHALLAGLLALSLAVDGLSRLATVVVVRFRRWRDGILFSLVELVMAVLIVTDWPVPPHLDIPLCVSLFLAGSGVSIVRFAVMLRNEQEEVAIYAFSLFGGRNWNENAPVLFGEDEPSEGPQAPMRIHVWTPAGAVNTAPRRPIIDRYLGALSEDGALSTGHAALDCPPHVYISHWPAAEVERKSSDFMRILYAGAENDVEGLFQPSYEFESDYWMPSTRQVEFSRFNERRLKAYWAGYSQMTTYNVTNRNCSIAVAGAIESALEGSLDNRYPWFRLVTLLLTPALWEAAYIRSRAEHLCWTPGLVLDYALAVRRLVEPAADRGVRTSGRSIATSVGGDKERQAA